MLRCSTGEEGGAVGGLIQVQREAVPEVGGGGGGGGFAFYQVGSDGADEAGEFALRGGAVGFCNENAGGCGGLRGGGGARGGLRAEGGRLAEDFHFEGGAVSRALDAGGQRGAEAVQRVGVADRLLHQDAGDGADIAGEFAFQIDKDITLEAVRGKAGRGG